MKDNSLWAIVIVVVIVLAIFLLGSGGNVGDVALDTTTKTQDVYKTPTPAKTTTPTAPAPVSGMKTSLGGIFNERGSYQCDYEAVTTSTRVANTVYVAGGLLRGEFRTLDALLSKSTIVVYDGDYLYTWTEGQTTGKISQPKTLSDLSGIIPEDVSSGKVLGSGLNSVSWYCHPWAKDASKLKKPTYVQFN